MAACRRCGLTEGQAKKHFRGIETGIAVSALDLVTRLQLSQGKR